MAEPSPIEQRFEQKLAAIIDGAEKRGTLFSDDDVNEIRDLLLKAGKKTWSARPRTYAVLRMIDKPNLLDEFVAQGLSDYNFPYAMGRIPLCLRSPSERRSFSEKQRLVLTDIKGAEQGEHASLATNADAHFQVLQRLGKGGQAQVDQVRSNLSLKDFARKSMLRSRKFEGSTESELAFTNELRNLKRLSHLHLVRYVGSYTDPRVFSILLLPIAESDLKTYLSRDPFPQEDLPYLRDFFGCITSAITYLHRNSCRHKDITSKNILIKHHKVFVTDFGLALDWSELSKSKTEGPRGAVSRDYVAPEVWDECGMRGSSSDMWPLGCVFLDIVTVLKGRKLVEKREFLEQHGSAGIEAPPRTNPRENYDGYLSWMERLREVNPRQDTLPISWIKKLIVFDPDRRSTAEELLNEILTCTDVEDGYTYHCLDCDGDNGGEVPLPRALRGSGSGEDEDEDVRESISKKYTGTLESIEEGLCNAVRRGDKKDTWRWLNRWTTRPNHQPEMTKSKALHLAATGGFIVIVTDLLRHGFDVNTNIHQSYPLHGAVEQGHLDTVRVLLDQDADPNARNAQHLTPLHQACNLGLEQVVEILLENGADVTATDLFSRTPLHYAVSSKNTAIATKLLTRPGIDLDIGGSQGSITHPFFLAVSGGVASLVKAFIDSGVNVNEVDPITGFSPLHTAVFAKALDVARLLISNGADVNAKLATQWKAPPLFIAIQKNDESMVRQLLYAGADPDITDCAGNTAVHAVAQHGFPLLLPILVQNGFDVNRQNELHHAPIGQALQLKRMDIAQALLDNGATLQGFPLKDGRPTRTLLHDAAFLNHTEALGFLVNFKGEIPIESRDSAQMTPLMIAAIRGHVDSAEILIDNGAEVETKDLEKKTALFWAIFYRHRDVVELLLKKEANVRARSLNGQTPLHLAVLTQNLETTRLLLDWGADPHTKDKEGKTALQRARLHGTEEIVELLSVTAGSSSNCIIL